MPKLLVIDDEIDILESSKSYFKKRGVDVLTASNGTDALKIIAEDSPNLILLDYNLPDIMGVEILRRIREDLKLDTKVLMVTGMEEEMVIRETEKYGILGCIHKPLNLQDLEQKVLTELNG